MIKNFSLSEFTASAIAKARGIDNSVPDALEPQAFGINPPEELSGRESGEGTKPTGQPLHGGKRLH